MGCLPDFLPAEKIAILAENHKNTFQELVKKGQYLTVGARRLMLPISVDGVFEDDEIYASPELTHFLSNALGPTNLLSCYTCIVALPQAPEQHLHRDYALFSNPVDYFSPSFAVNLFIPLVALNEINGTTQIWPSSHRKPGLEKETSGIKPKLEPGSAILMDYRVMHRGTRNRSNEMRPVLCLSYSRDWFLDARHYKDINPLQIEPKLLVEMPPQHQALFARAKLYSNLQST